MNTVCPSEERLKSLILEAFDELPAPDSARIEQIASTLAIKVKKQRNQPSRPRHHWLFWLLMGASMTATAWWGGKTLLNYLLPPATEVILQQPLQEPAILEQQTAEQQLPIKAPDKKQAKPHKKDSPVIYKRELY